MSHNDFDLTQSPVEHPDAWVQAPDQHIGAPDVESAAEPFVDSVAEAAPAKGKSNRAAVARFGDLSKRSGTKARVRSTAPPPDPADGELAEMAPSTAWEDAEDEAVPAAAVQGAKPDLIGARSRLEKICRSVRCRARRSR